MSDGLVIVTLSVQDAEALRAWQRGKQGIGEMGQELKGTKSATASAYQEQKKLADGFAQLSAAGKTAFQNQTAWSKGLSALDKQRAEEARKVAEAEKQAADAQAKAAAKAEKAANKAAAAQRKQAAQHRAANDQLVRDLSNTALKWIGVSSAIDVARRALGSFLDVSEQVRASQADVTFTLDETFRKYTAQAGIGDAGRQAAAQKLIGISSRQATPIQTVEGIARQLVSSGYTNEQVLAKGGVAETMVATSRAAALTGEEFDPKRMGEAATHFLLAQGGAETADQKKLPADVRAQLLSTDKFKQLMQDTHALYENANLQFEDLQFFAEAAPALARAGIDMRTQLAMAAQMREVLDAETAATSLRNIVSRMRTAGASKEKTAALASIGLKPEDIDLEGESIDEALGRFRDALAGSDKVTQDIVLKKIFEEKGAQGASVLIEQAAQLQMFRAMAGDHSKFAIAHQQVTSGPAAAKTRQEIQKQAQRFEGVGARDELIKQAIENQIAEHPELSAYGATIYSRIRNWSMGYISPEKALKLAVGPTNRDRILARLREVQAAGEMPAGMGGGADEAAAVAPGAAPDPARIKQYAQRKAAAEQEAQAKVDDKAAAKVAKQIASLEKKRDALSDQQHELAERLDDRRQRIRDLEEDQRLREAERLLPHRHRGEAAEAIERQKQARDDREHRQQIDRERREERDDKAREQKMMEEQNALLRELVKLQGGAAKGGAAVVNRPGQRPPPVIGGN